MKIDCIYFKKRKGNTNEANKLTTLDRLVNYWGKREYKFFGVVINENLRWNNHVNYISYIISHNIDILCKLNIMPHQFVYAV